MGIGQQKWTEEMIAKRIKDGRGQGEGTAYSPWLFVQEFSSKGTQTRVAPGKLLRTVHTFSYLELALFYFLEFQTNFAGYKEQFPMDRRTTLGAALGLGIRHPIYPKTGIPVVMTLDAIATHTDPEGGNIDVAWDAKPFKKLSDRRVLEKLSLHKAYCHHQSIQHRTFTERSVPQNVIKNIAWARGSLEVEGELPIVPGQFGEHIERMLSELRKNYGSKTIRAFCCAYDRAHHLTPGAALRVFRNLVWRHLVSVSLNVRDIELEPIPKPVDTPVTATERRAA